jgi:acetyl-CoA C-acetyltransferase
MLKAQASVASAVRTPIGRFLGSLSGRSSIELGVLAARAALERAGLKAGDIDLTIVGNARPAGLGPNPARQIAIKTGVPQDKVAYTLNMACGSSSTAIILGIQALTLGRAKRVLVGGSENMSRVPYLLTEARMGYRMGHAPVVDGMYRDGFDCPIAKQVMGLTAETLAREYEVSRDEQDRYALMSQTRAAKAWEERAFDAEIEEIPAEGKLPGLDHDEHLRPNTTLEKLAKLPTVFDENGSVTAGSSSGLTDAACMLVLEKPGLREKPLASILESESAGVDPARMGLGPVPATRALMKRCRLKIDDFELIELNEAFAAQVLACQRELRFDMEKTNVHGGAIALGHPIGATGARITTTLIHALRRHGKGLGLSTLCVSGGLGVSILVRNEEA